MQPVEDWVPWLKRWLFLPLLSLNGSILALVYHYFQPLIHTLIVAALLAFLLNFPVKLLQRFRIPRGRGVLLVFLATLTCLGVLGFTLIPLLLDQVQQLSHRIPAWSESGNHQMLALQIWVRTHYPDFDLLTVQQQLLKQLSESFQSFGRSTLGWLPNAFEDLFRLFLTTVLTFYLLLHGPRLWQGIFEVLPWRRSEEIQSLIHQNFRNYFTGQFLIAMLVGLLMSTTFVILQLPFAGVFGLGVGLLALFPFGKSVGLMIVTVIAAFINVWLGMRVAIAGFLIDQLTEQAISPMLMGHLTGLNPVWILVSLLMGAKIAGLLGLVLAVPVAATLKQSFEKSQTRRSRPSLEGPTSLEGTTGRESGSSNTWDNSWEITGETEAISQDLPTAGPHS